MAPALTSYRCLAIPSRYLAASTTCHRNVNYAQGSGIDSEAFNGRCGLCQRNTHQDYGRGKTRTTVEGLFSVAFVFSVARGHLARVTRAPVPFCDILRFFRAT